MEQIDYTQLYGWSEKKADPEVKSSGAQSYREQEPSTDKPKGKPKGKPKKKAPAQNDDIDAYNKAMEAELQSKYDAMKATYDQLGELERNAPSPEAKLGFRDQRSNLRGQMAALEGSLGYQPPGDQGEVPAAVRVGQGLRMATAPFTTEQVGYAAQHLPDVMAATTSPAGFVTERVIKPAYEKGIYWGAERMGEVTEGLMGEYDATKPPKKMPLGEWSEEAEPKREALQDRVQEANRRIAEYETMKPVYPGPERSRVTAAQDYEQGQADVYKKALDKVALIRKQQQVENKPESQ